MLFRKAEILTTIYHSLSLRLPLFFAIALLPFHALAQVEIPDEVLDIFDESCAFSGCHSGPTSARGLDLTEDFAASSLVNRPSKAKSNFMRAKPADPVNSYLVMKLKGSPGIAGDRMPKGSDALSASQISVIESWIASLPASTASSKAPEREYAEAFPGMSSATLPTPETLESGTFSYRIAHRWRGAVSNGFDELFGLDAGARMYTQFDFSLSNDLMVSVGRSAENATFEFSGKWRFLREKSDGSAPFSAAVRAGVDWATLAGLVDPDNPTSGQFLSRTNGERFHWFLQLPVSKKLHERFSVLLVPGMLFNGNVNVSDEDAIFTLGWVAQLMLFKDFSIFFEGVPILSGESDANSIGGPRVESGELVINDAFTIGLERRVGGHVFHVYITNSLGLATNQYMSGGNFDFSGGDFRLGFNIYRTMQFPF